jgi:hypothetical protein
MKKLSFTTSTTHFLQEGRENLRKTLGAAFRAAKEHQVEKIVIFTAKGEGVRVAVEEFQSLPEYGDIKLIAVTFPRGKTFKGPDGKPFPPVDIDSADEELFRDRGIPIVRAHLPFDPISSPHSDRGPLAQSLSLVGDALSMFGGSMSLCVQAVTLACDAGAVGMGEHVVSLTSDTAILVQASCTRLMLQQLIIREIVCKPAILTVTKKETSEDSVDELAPVKGRRRLLSKKGA